MRATVILAAYPIVRRTPTRASEDNFHSAWPATASTNAFLAIMITASNYAQAKLIIDQGVASDGRFPTQSVYLAKSTDRLRNIRYAHFDNTIFDFRVAGGAAPQRTKPGQPHFPDACPRLHEWSATFHGGLECLRAGRLDGQPHVVRRRLV